MTSKLTYWGTVGLGVAFSATASPALAAGTTAGTSITNTATVDYQVGGVAQTQKSGSDTFIVDRKINLTVAEVGAVTTNVVPGQTNAVTTFQLTNGSNEVLDFALVASQTTTGGAAVHSGTDAFDVSNVRIYRDSTSGNVGSWDAADTLVTYVDELAADASATLFVVADIPGGPTGPTNGQIAGVTLRATAREGGAIGNEGAAITQTTGTNTAGKDTVFADVANPRVTGDAARDGSYADSDDYTVQTATLAVIKSSRVISDDFNGTTNPKLIPGAIVEYCIQVANSGGAAATSVVINDAIPTQLTYETTPGIKLNGTVTGGTCNADGVTGGSIVGSTVSGTIATIAPGDTRTLVFRAKVK